MLEKWRVRDVVRGGAGLIVLREMREMQRSFCGCDDGERRKFESSQIVGRGIGRIEGILQCVVLWRG